MLSENLNAIHLLEVNPDKIDWRRLSENPNGIHLLEVNPDKIDWRRLSKNPNGIHLLEANPDKINWFWLFVNPNIFEIDYQYLKDRMKNTFVEELIMNRFHPKNVDKWIDWELD